MADPAFLREGGPMMSLVPATSSGLTVFSCLPSDICHGVSIIRSIDSGGEPHDLSVWRQSIDALRK